MPRAVSNRIETEDQIIIYVPKERPQIVGPYSIHTCMEPELEAFLNSWDKTHKLCGICLFSVGEITYYKVILKKLRVRALEV